MPDFVDCCCCCDRETSGADTPGTHDSAKLQLQLKLQQNQEQRQCSGGPTPAADTRPSPLHRFLGVDRVLLQCRYLYWLVNERSSSLRGNLTSVRRLLVRIGTPERQETYDESRFVVGTCEASTFDSNSKRLFQFDSRVMGRFENFLIGRACPLLVVVKRLKPLTALSGTVYRVIIRRYCLMCLRIGMRNLYSSAHLFCFICN